MTIIKAACPTCGDVELTKDQVRLVVHAVRGPDGPRVMSILAVEDLTAGHDAVQFTTTELFSRVRYETQLTPTGMLPLRATHRLERAGIDVRSLLDDRAVSR